MQIAANNALYRAAASFALVLAGTLSSGCLFPDGGDDAPPPDDCSSPRALPALDDLELGTLDYDIQTGTEVFVPWDDDVGVIDIIGGLQGADMVGVAFRLRGAELPACVTHEFTLRAQNTVYTSTSYPVKTYVDEGVPNARRSDTVWMVLGDYPPGRGTTVTLEGHIGDVAISRELLVEAPMLTDMALLGASQLYPFESRSVELRFDRYAYAGTEIDLEVSDPAIIELDETRMVVAEYNAGYTVAVGLTARASGGPVTLRATVNGRSVEIDLSVSER